MVARSVRKIVKTQRELSEKCLGAGHWIIEGYDVHRATGSGSVKRWLINDPCGNRVGQPATLGQARQMIRDLLGELRGLGSADRLQPYRRHDGVLCVGRAYRTAAVPVRR